MYRARHIFAGTSEAPFDLNVVGMFFICCLEEGDDRAMVGGVLPRGVMSN